MWISWTTRLEHAKPHANFIQDWLGAFFLGLARTPLGVVALTYVCAMGASLVPELLKWKAHTAALQSQN
jgi:hypothetical protein